MKFPLRVYPLLPLDCHRPVLHTRLHTPPALTYTQLWLTVVPLLDSNQENWTATFNPELKDLQTQLVVGSLLKCGITFCRLRGSVEILKE